MENKPKIGLVTEIDLAHKAATLKFSHSKISMGLGQPCTTV